MRFTFELIVKQIALPNVVGLVQSVEGLNGPKSLTLPQVTGNPFCLTAFKLGH